MSWIRHSAFQSHSFGLRVVERRIHEMTKRATFMAALGRHNMRRQAMDKWRAEHCVATLQRRIGCTRMGTRRIRAWQTERRVEEGPVEALWRTVLLCCISESVTRHMSVVFHRLTSVITSKVPSTTPRMMAHAFKMKTRRGSREGKEM